MLTKSAGSFPKLHDLLRIGNYRVASTVIVRCDSCVATQQAEHPADDSVPRLVDSCWSVDFHYAALNIGG